MKYIVDIDSLIECLDCVDSIRFNGECYIQKHLLKEFLLRFPKDALSEKDVVNFIAKDVMDSMEEEG